MKKRILVVSSANMDLLLNMNRVPGAGETIKDNGKYSYMPGGKGANAAITIAKLGGDCVFCARLGDDANASLLKKFYTDNKIDTRFIKSDSSAQTGLAVVMVESSAANRIVAYPGANANLCSDDVEEAFMCYPDALYLNFEIPFESIVTACSYAKKQNIPIIIDGGPANTNTRFDLLGEIEIFSPNEVETYKYTGISPTNMENCLRAASALYKKMKVKYIVIKLGERGCFIYDGIHYNVCASYETDVIDTTGAGDAFTGAMTLKYLQSGDIINACKYANAVGAIVVSRPGASSGIPTSEEVGEFIKSRELV